MNYVQIGVMQMRDPVTGKPVDSKIPIYAELAEGVAEEEVNDIVGNIPDIAGVFAEKIATYLRLSRIKKIKEDI